MSGRRFGSRRTTGRVKPSRTRLALESLETRQLLATFTVTNIQNSGAGSLRDAIDAANAKAGADTIAFDIAGTGVQTIHPITALPAIIDPVTIDGRTQHGYSGQPLIEISGDAAPAGTNGLRLAASNVSVLALAINRFDGSGIRVNASQDTIQLCFIGTSPAGNTAAANGNFGIFVNNGSNNIIGGFDTNAGPLANVISGNTNGGISLFGSGASSNLIFGNFIGTDISGATALPNVGDGVAISDGSLNQIGGNATGQGNVISGNTGNGILITGATARNNSIVSDFIGVDGNPGGGVGGGASGGGLAIPNGGAGVMISGAPRTFIGGNDGSSGNIISGNKGAGISLVSGDSTEIFGNIIGADRSGVKNLGNKGAGVAINGGDNSLIGGTLGGAGNVIAWNGQGFQDGGVNIFSGRRIPILGNSIFSNFGPGIVLFSAAGQPVPNDGGDADSGPNDLQNYPVLTKAATAAGRTLLQGSLDSMPNTTYTVQFFSNASQDPSLNGEGETFLGQALITTDGNGHADINLTLPNPAVIGQWVSATATDPQGNTSEFALDTQVVQAKQANLAISITAAPNPSTLGSDLTYTITIINSGPDDATGVRLNQVLPASVSFKSGSAETPAGTVLLTPTSSGVVGDLGTLSPGMSVTATVVVTPSVIGDITTTATVSSGEIDPDDTDNIASQTTTVDIPADLGLALHSEPAMVTVGQNTTIVAIVTNNGPGVATGTVLTVTLPPGVSFVSAAAGQASVVFANGVVTARIGTLARSVSSAVRITVTAPIDVPLSGNLSITGTVSANEIEPDGPDPTPNTVNLDIPVLPSSDLALTFVPNQDPILAGSNLTYTYTITNNGPSPATGIILTDAIPDGMDFVAAPPPSQGTASFADGTVTVAIGSLAPAGTATGTITVTPTKPGVIPNTATVTLDQPDPDPTNNKVTSVATVSPADLSVNTSVAPDPAEAGKNLTYTIFIKNNGPADATNVLFTDILPVGVTFLSAISTQGTVVQVNGLVTGSLGTITSGASVPVTIVITPSISSALSNKAFVSSDQVDTNPGNNSQTVTTNVSPADVSVALSASPSSVLAGDTLTFTAFVTNTGPSTASNVVLGNLLPPGLQFVSATTSQGTVTPGNNGVTVQVGTLPAAGSATVTIVARPVVEGTYLNTVSVSSSEVDPVLANNFATATATVTNGPGVLQFAATTFSSPENAGTATITVTRASGNKGSVTVHYATSDATGINGLNYKSVSGTLTFNNGEISKTFTVPLIDDGTVNGDTTIHLSLTSPTGGAVLGVASAATLVATESDFDLTGPQILSAQPRGNGRLLTGVALAFDEALDPTRASNPANYTLFVPSKNGRGESQVAILPPTYDPATHTVTITAGRALALNTFYRVVVNGAGVTDIFNNALRGDSTLINGRDYTATFARGSSLKFADHDGDLVSINLSNGGLLDLYRSSNGDGQVLTVLGAGARRSVLSGTVRRGNNASDGVTALQSIVGANFGQVNSRLTTPKFYVDSVTEFIKGSGSSTVAASSIATATATVSTQAAHHGRLFARRFRHRIHH